MTFSWQAYCQLIREQNKAKRLKWAIENEDAAFNSEFTDVAWTDECSVQLESHQRFSCRNRKSKQNPSQGKQAIINYYLFKLYFHTFRPKHPAKVHVWAGISW